MSSNSFYLDGSYVEVHTADENVILEQENGNAFPDQVTISYRDLLELVQKVRKMTTNAGV